MFTNELLRTPGNLVSSYQIAALSGTCGQETDGEGLTGTMKTTAAGTPVTGNQIQETPAQRMERAKIAAAKLRRGEIKGIPGMRIATARDLGLKKGTDY